jgi:hypothetical protein
MKVDDGGSMARQADLGNDLVMSAVGEILCHVLRDELVPAPGPR